MDGQQDGDSRSKVLPTPSKDQVHEHLRSLNVCKSVGLIEMPPRALRELTGVTVMPLSTTVEKSLQSNVVMGDWKRGNTTPVIKKSRKEDPKKYQPVGLTSMMGI